MPKRLNHNLNRRLNRYTTRMLNGARRPPEPNYLSIACRLFATYIRLRERSMKRDAEYTRECRRILEQHEREQMFAAAVKRVYGPDALPSES